MTTLNPDLLDSNTRAAMNRASELMRQHGKPVLMPELALLALLRMPQSTAYRAVAHLAESRGFTVAELDKEVEAQVRARTGRAANFNYLTDQNSTVQVSDEMVIALDEARSIALASGEIYIATEHLLGALSQTGVSTAGLLQRKGVTPTALASLIVDGIVSKRATTTDWVQQARQGQLPPLYYRENLLRDLVTLLALARDPHVILIGEPGSGRRSLVQSLALMIAEGKGPAHVKKVVEVSDAAWLDNPMLAMQVAMRQAENGVLFIANIQRFLGGQLRADLPQAGKDLQKAFVSDGAGPIIIGTTTDADYAERIKPNTTIAGRAHVLRVPPATPDECQKMLATLRPQFERNYSIAIAEDALKTATTLAARYVGGAPLPGSAVQVLHRACAAVRATASERQQTADYRLQITDDRQQTTD
ncbi:MAG: Clp protease N-terminal domain-containing protein, partial [Anaerolineae bacterium]